MPSIQALPTQCASIILGMRNQPSEIELPYNVTGMANDHFLMLSKTMTTGEIIHLHGTYPSPWQLRVRGEDISVLYMSDAFINNTPYHN